MNLVDDFWSENGEIIGVREFFYSDSGERIAVCDIANDSGRSGTACIPVADLAVTA